MLEAVGLRFSYSRFRRRWILRDFNWRVPSGQATLLLGPNGAGKSSLLSLFAGIRRPQRGYVSYAGSRRVKDLYRNVGWMPQNIEAARGLSSIEQLEYAAWLAGLDAGSARRAAAEALELVRLGEKRDERTTGLSGGQLRRLGLAQALVRRADVLLLDEPTAGLDPAQLANFRDILADLPVAGGVVVSSHQVTDLIHHVDRVAVLRRGEIIFDDTADRFMALQRPDEDSLNWVFNRMVEGGAH